MSNFQRQNSGSTINSSEAENDLGNIHPESTFSRPFLEGAIPSQNNVKIDGSKVIHVGDVVNNYYQADQSKENVKESSNSESSCESKKNIKSFKSRVLKNVVKRKLMILLVTVSIIIGFSAWLSYFVISGSLDVKKKVFDEETTTHIPSDNPTTTSSSTKTQTSSYSSSTTPHTTSSLIESSSTTLVPPSPSSTISTENPPFPLILREDWNAGKLDDKIKKLSLPIKRVVVAHTGKRDDFCSNLSDCLAKVKLIQVRNTDMFLADIPYNFLISKDGWVFEGRGFFEGEHSSNPNGSSFNSIGICIAFMGVYSDEKPSELQIVAFESFIQSMSENGELAEDYKVFSQQQLVEIKIEANELQNSLTTMKNYYSRKFKKC